jgi:mannose-6-phosphate isomerase-like protein (cupin superfamily)
MKIAYSPEIQEILAAWQPYISKLAQSGDWQSAARGITPKATGCGPVYELAGPLDRPGESFAIADMREIPYAQPHYHTGGETEIYFVIAGQGMAVVGGRETLVTLGDIVVTPPGTAHYLIPASGLVVAVVNTPPFNPANNVDLAESNPKVGFDSEQFRKLTRR